MRILICDDDPKLVSALERDLRSLEHAVDAAGTCAEAEDRVAGDAYGLVVLDRMLPDGDGMGTCRALRAMGLDTPVLILSGLGDTDQKVLGRWAVRSELEPAGYRRSPDMSVQSRSCCRRSPAFRARASRCSPGSGPGSTPPPSAAAASFPGSSAP